MQFRHPATTGAANVSPNEPLQPGTGNRHGTNASSNTSGGSSFHNAVMKTWKQSPIFDPGVRNQWSTGLRLAGVTLVLLVAAVISGCPFGPFDQQSGDLKIYVSKLREEFRKISPPPGATPTEDPTVHAKRWTALIQGRYASHLPIDSVLRSYRQQLSSNGWTYWGQSKGLSNWREIY
jgi:hypothetical protein